MSSYLRFLDLDLEIDVLTLKMSLNNNIRIIDYTVKTHQNEVLQLLLLEFVKNHIFVF